MNNVKREMEKTMNHLAKLLTKLQKTKRNDSSKSSARKRFGNRLGLERLEERALMAQLAFGTPLNFGLGVNTSANEEGPSMTADGLSLLFRRDQVPNPQVTEILEATRISTSVPFGNVVSAGAVVNSSVLPGHPEVSDDGLTLLFKKDEGGITGLYQATRENRSQPFGSVSSLGDLLSGQREESPSLSADGLTLYFTAWDTSNVQNDIYQATRSSVSDPWSNVVKLSSAINVPGYNDAMPSISNDGLMLFYNSNRPGGYGAFDLFVSTRATPNAPWGNAVNVGPQVNSPADDKGAEISADGKMLYFHSNRVGGVGLEDLYQAEILGVASDTKFYVVDDASTDRTYEYQADGIATDGYQLAPGNTQPRGAASTALGAEVWVVDANKKVYVYNNSGTVQDTGWSAGGLQSSSIAGLQGITTNGVDVWLVEDTFSSNKNDKIYRYNGAASRNSGSQNVSSSFSLNSANRNPTDLVTDGTSIWVLNNTSTTDSVFKYTLGGTLLGSWTITGGGGNPTGITLDPSPNATMDMWIVDNSSDSVYRLPGARNTVASSIAASDPFALATFNNTNPQGIADPPPPASKFASQGPRGDLGKSMPEVEKPNRKILSSSDPFIAQVDSIFENWNENSESSQAKKRLAGRR